MRRRSDRGGECIGQWHTDVMYVWLASRFYFLLSFVDAFSRYIVHHKLLISLDGKAVATELQAALETVQGAKPRVDFTILWPKFQQSMATDSQKPSV